MLLYFLISFSDFSLPVYIIQLIFVCSSYNLHICLFHLLALIISLVDSLGLYIQGGTPQKNKIYLLKMSV